MAVIEFTRKNLKDIREDIKDALKAVETKYGIVIKQGNISFADNSFKMKLEAFVGESDADAGKIVWDSWCFKYGLKSEDFGKTFKSNGTEFTVCGMKPKSTKYPVLAQNAAGTVYKFSAQVVK